MWYLQLSFIASAVITAGVLKRYYLKHGTLQLAGCIVVFLIYFVTWPVLVIGAVVELYKKKTN